ncbi:sugar phosphate isomerase/epimerase [Hoeflea sp. IMCC20628]|uniref:sugar phosphate isomerase/epimerase family protein n=1 Tax=Hoeflea sp. IMCC20628 TaxID=1620421 RepID=UPI00063AC95F|nr:sugar phosphate isomerase/epimerase family protein [Hoeflea sp. IMCC20628]AKH99686.1 sugar phosphate isomerase/epimerase [Hoeflea sp. IMCC20628]
MSYKNSILLGTIGGYRDRFHQFQPDRTFEERLEIAKKIPRTHGVEPVYPQDLGADGAGAKTIQKSGLAVSAVNVNVKTEDKFRDGSFTNPDAGIRKEAVQYLKTSMDLAAELKAEMITVCPLIDGWDYAFQADHIQQWRWMIEAFAEAAAHRDDVKVSIEYKAYESKNHIILPSMGRTLHFCDRVGAKNLGVTMDVGHALIAGESPGSEIAVASEAGRLFYIHFNDNDRGADWDMLPASVHLWETLETLHYMRRIGYDGWVAYDVFTRSGDNAEAIAATFEIMENLDALLDKIGDQKAKDLITGGHPQRTYNDLIKALL